MPELETTVLQDLENSFMPPVLIFQFPTVTLSLHIDILW